MKKLYPFITCLLIAYSATVSAQNVSTNQSGTPPDASAMLDVSSTTKGMLLPRMSSAQRQAITSPANGLLVYDTDRKAFFLFDSSSWKIMVALDPNSANSYSNVQNTIPTGVIDGSDF